MKLEMSTPLVVSKVDNRKCKLPSKGYVFDAAYDLYWNPSEGGFEKFREGIHRGDKTLVLETGIRVAIPENCVGLVYNRSSVASRGGVVVGACVIDEGYSGEVFVNLLGFAERCEDWIFNLKPQDRVAQLVIHQIPDTEIEEVSQEEYFEMMEMYERGDKGFGSTGR